MAEQYVYEKQKKILGEYEYVVAYFQAYVPFEQFQQIQNDQELNEFLRQDQVQSYRVYRSVDV